MKISINFVKDQYNNSIDKSAILDIPPMESRGITISDSSYRKRENDNDKTVYF